MRRERKPQQYRKIQLSSSKTRLVSLPRDWAERYSIKRDSVVIIRELPGGALLLLPTKKTDEGKKIELTDSKRIRRDLLRAYLDGHDIIEIYGAQGPLKRRDLILESSRKLIGLEVLEEKSDRIELHFLIEPSPTLDPLLLIRRCFSIAAGMERDTIQAMLTGDTNLAQSVIKRDDEVDRLYFLIVRILRTATHLISETAPFQLIDALNLRMLASYAESMADQVVDIALHRVSRNLIPELGEEPIQEILNIREQIITRLDEAVQIYLERNVEAASELVEQRKDLESDLEHIDEYLGKHSAPETYRVLSSVIGLLRRNIELVVDVADLV
ncbi:MAG: PhoU domain-containing protein [Candidatus Heimdallarchaeota archaeon]